MCFYAPVKRRKSALPFRFFLILTFSRDLSQSEPIPCADEDHGIQLKAPET